MPDTHRLEPGNKVDLAGMPTRADDFHPDREAAEREFRELRDEIIEAQHRLYSEGKQSLLVVLHGPPLVEIHHSASPTSTEVTGVYVQFGPPGPASQPAELRLVAY